MFVHGVCALLKDGRYYSMRQLAFTGWHLPEPLDREYLREKLERTASAMAYMAKQRMESIQRASNVRSAELWARQNQYAAQVLCERMDLLIEAFLVAKQPGN